MTDSLQHSAVLFVTFIVTVNACNVIRLDDPRQYDMIIDTILRMNVCWYVAPCEGWLCCSWRTNHAVPYRYRHTYSTFQISKISGVWLSLEELFGSVLLIEIQTVWYSKCLEGNGCWRLDLRRYTPHMIDEEKSNTVKSNRWQRSIFFNSLSLLRTLQIWHFRATIGL